MRGSDWRAAATGRAALRAIRRSERFWPRAGSLAGARNVDLALALEKIGIRFGVRTLMLEGGGRINGGMLRDGFIDEVSLLVAPIADGRIGTPALFDVEGDFVPRRLTLEAVERRADDVLWLRYRVELR